MPVDIVVPDLGEAGTEATVEEWLKQSGDPVKKGEPVVVIETDKVALEIEAEVDGVLAEIRHEAGEDVEVGDVLGIVDETVDSSDSDAERGETTPQPAASDVDDVTQAESEREAEKESSGVMATPVARRLATEQNVDLSQIKGTGAQDKIMREDVEQYIDGQQQDQKRSTPESKPDDERPRASEERRERMSRRRRTIARRLVEVQQTAAMLTTFNDVDMSAIMALRGRHKERFREQHDVNLGISSFFVKAAVGALKAFPMINAELDGDEIIIKDYYDIGVAIGAEDGLVVPVIRDADRKTFAQIEAAIKGYARSAQDGTLSLNDLRGGTFTLTNGGIFGSLLSTPILNPPQVAILGMHRIEERPVVIDGEVEVHQMMYLALSYDHRVVDGRESVQFLAKIKELLESPEVLLIEG